MPSEISSSSEVTIGGFRFAMAGATACDRVTLLEAVLPRAMLATITGAGSVNGNDWDYPLTITGTTNQSSVVPDTSANITGLANALVKFLFPHPTLGEVCICGTLISPTVSGSNVTATLRVVNHATVPSLFGVGSGHSVTFTVAGVGISAATPGTLGTQVVLTGNDAVVGKVMAVGLNAELPSTLSLVYDNGTSKIHSHSQQALAGTAARFQVAQAVNLNNRLTNMATNLANGFNHPNTTVHHVVVCNLSHARINRVRCVLGMSD